MLEHVPDGGKDRVTDRDRGLVGAATNTQARVLGGEVGVLAAVGALGALDQRLTEPLGALARLARAALARGLVVARAHAGPGREVLGRREGGHVAAGLGDYHFGRAAPDTRDRAEQLNRRRERAQLLLDRARELVDRLVEIVDVREDPPDDQDVLSVKAALQRCPQRGQLLAQLAAREIGEHARVGRAGHERVEHRAAGLAHHVGGDAIEFDAGVLHHLVQPVHLALAITDLALAVARQVAQRRGIGFGGTKLGRSSPASSSWQSHWASMTSVLRPGTCLT